MMSILQVRHTVGTVFLFLGLLAGTSCGSANSGNSEILIFAATSLTNALDEAIAAYEARNTVQVLVSYGGSQTLAQQIATGAPADIFISAGRFPVDFLEEREVGMLNKTDLLSNRLVLVTEKNGPNLNDLLDLTSDKVGRVAMAAPDLAPAGGYAKESLVNLGLWDELQSKMAFGADVRATMAYVESGNADVAFVYQTDAAIAGGLEVIDVVPIDSYSKIAYPAVLLSGGDNPAAATEFFDFLNGEEALRILVNHGFSILEGGK